MSADTTPVNLDQPAHRADLGIGPYNGRGSRYLAVLPKSLRGPIAEAGGMVQLLIQILRSAVTRPSGYWNAVIDDMHQTVKQAWLPIAAALFGFLIFMSILTVQFFAMAGATQLFGPLLFLQAIRTFTMWIVSMVVAGVIGTALTADIGARKVREEIDAMMVMGIDPIRDLAVPRVISLTLITTLIAVPSMLVTMVSMQLGASYVAQQPSANFYSNLFANVSPGQIVAVLLNCFLVGLLIGTICCYKGLTASGGPIGLGRSVNHAVVTSFIAVWVLQLAFNAMQLGLFPSMGSFR
ncbi:MAG: Phospholipid/cholesterol/gamma-HCH transport system permease protein [Aeromicrobium sp.]|nr:Phospholipid/cholesterol/gamma-HCH transport system permease protein [Aeromicrobium sp.]